MVENISFLCSSCHGRLRASTRYVGRSHPCPRCGELVVVPPRPPAEESSLIVFDDGHRLPRHDRWKL
jgi:hypothetical protein